MISKAQQTLDSLRYSETTSDIIVTVEPEFIEESSSPDENSYAFSYTVTIKNDGQARVQLIERHWIIMSGGAFYEEVKGEGVVGVQPVLESGEVFQYTSWAVIKDAIGSMRGAYTFLNAAGDSFDVKIPEFDLVYPHQLH